MNENPTITGPAPETAVQQIISEVYAAKDFFVKRWAELRSARLGAELAAAHRKVQAFRHARRPRIHFGASSRYENKIEHTYRLTGNKPHLYFRFASGQVVRADRKFRNPVIRTAVQREVAANANR